MKALSGFVVNGQNVHVVEIIPLNIASKLASVIIKLVINGTLFKKIGHVLLMINATVGKKLSYGNSNDCIKAQFIVYLSYSYFPLVKK